MEEEEEEESASIAERLGAWRRACTTPTSHLFRHWQYFALVLAFSINLTFDMTCTGDSLIVIHASRGSSHLVCNKTANPDYRSQCEFIRYMAYR
jgi:hypothetical protein